MRNKNLIIGITDRRNLVGFFMPENMKGMMKYEKDKSKTHREDDKAVQTI